MKCPKCDSDWPAGVKFCGDCGTTLEQAAAGGLPPAHAKVNEQLKVLLPQIGLGRFVEVDPGHHVCQRGSTHVDVRVVRFGEKVAVRSMAPVTVGSRLDADLMKLLLNHNVGFIFGAFGVDQKGTIGFGHSILASSMDVQELGASVACVLRVADRYDDQIVAKWGGKTAKQTAIEQLLPAHILGILRAGK